MKGRRVFRVEDIIEPGDYFGPTGDFTNGIPAVHFLKPNAHDPAAPKRAHEKQYVISPPHTFTEEPDGSLTVRASIGDEAGNSESDGWHGYLTKGEWHL